MHGIHVDVSICCPHCDEDMECDLDCEEHCDEGEARRETFFGLLERLKEAGLTAPDAAVAALRLLEM